MYAEAVDDDKLRLLAFEDRWHFVAILCLKAGGVLDSDSKTLERRIALKLGLMPKDLGEVKRRLMEVGLISTNWQPKNWRKRQFQSDTSTERTRKYRERIKNNDQKRHSDVTVTDQNRTDTEQSRTEQRPSESLLSQTSSFGVPGERSFSKERFDEDLRELIAKKRMPR